MTRFDIMKGPVDDEIRAGCGVEFEDGITILRLQHQQDAGYDMTMHSSLKIALAHLQNQEQRGWKRRIRVVFLDERSPNTLQPGGSQQLSPVIRA